MCGISGIVGDGNVEWMIFQQKHRGPDAQHMRWVDGGVYFGHNRLSIIDLTDKGDQPMSKGLYTITFNGEIYNYKELASYLCLKNEEKSLGDTAIFLRTINQFGLRRALNDAVGMWAFGLYDKLAHKVHLVVDRLGEKPLYYYLDNKVFAFASSPAALLHLKPKWKINKEALESYWKLGAVMRESIWEGIKRVNAAEQVTFDIATRKVTTEVYWRPEYKPNQDLRELIYNAIDRVQVADVPVYLFLSGGIDSSVVASRMVGGDAIHMYGPEATFAEEVAARFEMNLKVIDPLAADGVRDMTDYVTKVGEPSMSALVPYITANDASKYCKVAISANGADELFFGYDRTTQGISRPQFEHIFRAAMFKPGQDQLTWACEQFGEDYKFDPGFSVGRWFELMTYVQHDLNRTLDFASMCHGLEVRSPFLNHKLVEAALSTPPEEIGRKQMLKDILKEYGFTDRFLNRPKIGFTLYREPRNYDVLGAFHWAVMEGWLPRHRWDPRDFFCLKAAAFSFKIWYETFKNIIEK